MIEIIIATLLQEIETFLLFSDFHSFCSQERLHLAVGE